MKAQTKPLLGEKKVPASQKYPHIKPIKAKSINISLTLLFAKKRDIGDIHQVLYKAKIKVVLITV